MRCSVPAGRWIVSPAPNRRSVSWSADGPYWISASPDVTLIVSSFSWWYCRLSECPALTWMTLPMYLPSMAAKISSCPHGLSCRAARYTSASGAGPAAPFAFWALVTASSMRSGSIGPFRRLGHQPEAVDDLPGDLVRGLGGVEHQHLPGFLRQFEGGELAVH